MRKSREEFYEFDQGEKKFFVNLKKQPGIDKTLEILKESLASNLTVKGFDFQKIFEQAGNTGKISHKDICFLRQAKFEQVLEQYKLERKDNGDLITFDIVNRLESILEKIPHVLRGLSKVETTAEIDRNRDINIFAPSFLKSVENMSPPIIYSNGIFIDSAQFKSLEEIFMNSFRVNSLVKVREKINTLGLAQIGKNQAAFPWRHIIDSLYTLTRRKRTQVQLQRELPIGFDSDISRYINSEVSIGFFLNQIQNFTLGDVYVQQDLAGYFFNNFGNILTFTIGKGNGGFVNLTVELPTGMDIPRRGTVKGIQIIDITENGVIKGKIT